ncbi:PilZ domain-containing protein [bacterium]|nr:PilZ domain-containing protein [bacterium]
MRFVDVGQKIKIESSENKGVFFESVVSAVESDRIFVSLSDINQNVCDFFEEGDEIFCSVQTQFGIRLFNSMIIEFENNCVVIEYNPKDYEVFQRRQFVRVNVNMPAVIDINGKMLRVITVDLGGGGIKFMSDTPLEDNSIANMKITLNKGEPFVNIFGKIIKRDFYKENEYLFFFVNLDENVRTKIIKRCMDEQALQVRKSLDKNAGNN